MFKFKSLLPPHNKRRGFWFLQVDQRQEVRYQDWKDEKRDEVAKKRPWGHGWMWEIMEGELERSFLGQACWLLSFSCCLFQALRTLSKALLHWEPAVFPSSSFQSYSPSLFLGPSFPSSWLQPLASVTSSTWKTLFSTDDPTLGLTEVYSSCSFQPRFAFSGEPSWSLWTLSVLPLTPSHNFLYISCLS